MESLIDRSFDEQLVREQHRKKRIGIATAAAGVVAAVVIGFFVYHWYSNRTYDSYKVIESVSVKDAGSQKYAAYDGGVIRYGRDGVTAVDESGNSVWSASYDMASPSIDTCEESAVVADIGGKTLYVYKGGDTGVDFSVDYSIVQACVSRQGVVAVLLEETASNTIAVYNPFDQSQKLLVEIPTNVEDGYPVCMDLSPDGKSIAVSYLCVTSGVAVSRVAFYNFSEVGKNANCLVGAHNYDDSLIAEICFLDESEVCLFGEKGFYLWENMKQPKTVAKKEFSSEIKSAFCGGETVGVVLQKDDKTKMRLYNADGEKTKEVTVDDEYTNVQISNGEILFSSASRCVVYRTSGVKKFEKDFNKKISYFFPCQKNNRYFLVQNSKIKVIRLK